MDHCSTIDHLLEITNGTDHLLAKAAKSALGIIADVKENGPSGFDLEALHAILDGVYAASVHSLFDHLLEGSPDCEICAAIKARIEA